MYFLLASASWIVSNVIIFAFLAESLEEAAAYTLLFFFFLAIFIIALLAVCAGLAIALRSLADPLLIYFGSVVLTVFAFFEVLGFDIDENAPIFVLPMIPMVLVYAFKVRRYTRATI